VFRLHPLSRVAALVAALLCLMTLTAPAASATGGDTYRFWGYFQLANGSWAFAPTGPDGVTPVDGTVEGWRFAVVGPSDTRAPRATPTFEEICGGTDAAAGQKRVGVVLDYGRGADSADNSEPPAARAECAVVPEKATGADVLAAVAQTRVEGGMTCGIDGVPSKGCGDAVSDVPEQARAADEPVQLAGLATPTGSQPTAAAHAQEQAGEANGDDGGDGPGVLVWAGLGAIVLVAALTVIAMRRRRDLLQD
jgi:hypothetical protein